MPIGRLWQMVAVDILEVPLPCSKNHYLLLIQDYYSKWADATPLPNQTADNTTKELVKVFAMYGMPDILHSDQGRNFESSILCQRLEAFGIKSLGPQHITHKEMVWSSVLIVPCCRYFVLILRIMQNGRDTCHLFYLHTALLYMLQQE